MASTWSSSQRIPVSPSCRRCQAAEGQAQAGLWRGFAVPKADLLTKEDRTIKPALEP